MDTTHHTRDNVDNERRDCEKAQEGTAYYVLMNSAEYGTEAWPCTTLDEAVGTLAALARSAEERRRRDGIQRFFCIKGETFLEEGGAGAGVPDPDPCSPDEDAAVLLLHIPRGATACADNRRSRLHLGIQDAEEAERTPVGRGPGTPPAGTNAERRPPYALTAFCPASAAARDRSAARTGQLRGGRKADEPQADLRHYPHPRREAHGRLRQDARPAPDNGERSCSSASK